MVLYRYNSILHRIALLTACATFPLIFMGGLVTSKGAGLSVPDWPNSYGYNMWLFPPSLWWNQGGIFYEHSHRLMGTVVGFLSMLLVLNAWGVGDRRGWKSGLKITAGASLLLVVGAIVMVRLGVGSEKLQHLLPHFAVGFASLVVVSIAGLFARRIEPRAWVRWLTVSVFVLVCIQGVLGGTRVTQVSLMLAMIHGVTAQAFFCVAAFAAIVTSKWWNVSPNLAWSEDYTAGQRLMRVATIAFGCVFLQLIVGAVMRHEQAGLAVPDVPLIYGTLLPPMNAAELSHVNAERAFEFGMDPVTLPQIWLHVAHRLGAILVSVVALWLAVRVFHRHSGQSKLSFPAMTLCVLLLTQVTLGVLTVLLKKPADIASAHVACGALLLMTCFTIAVRSMRLYSRRFRTQSAAVRVEVRSIGSREFLAT